MGIADIVPGISGATVALITGIYKEWIDSLKSIRFSLLITLKNKGIKDCLQEFNFYFLFTVFLGILFSLWSLSNLILYLIEHYPIALWSFFLGLIFSSAIFILKQTSFSKWIYFFYLFIGIAMGYLITNLSSFTTPNTTFFIFIAGFIAICAMMLPGISGSFLLLIMNKYEFILLAIKNHHFPIIITFALGCLSGLLSFSKLISWMLKKAKNPTLSILSGFMMGSLNKLWPWKAAIEHQKHHQSLVEQFLSPSKFTALTGEKSLVSIAFVFIIIGFFIPWIIEIVSKKIKT